MFLIVESGSTKADWVAVTSSGDTQFFETEGINPATQSTFFHINEHKPLLKEVRNASFIWFYGAGVIDELTKERIANWLISYGAKAKIEVESDIMAAARACSKNIPGIISILGTGSNSCVYDGQKRIDHIPSLGFILGDEGSGSHIGKEILREYFCKRMPTVVQKSFDNQFSISRENLIEKVYKQHAGSKYIASFASFLTNADESWKSKILSKVFMEFITYRICTLKDYKNYPIHFAGSIAYYHQRYLKDELDKFGLKLGSVIQKPIYELVDYHFKQIYK
jgi:glucosamine kinase